MPKSKRKRRLVVVVCPGHSGSTLLAMCLNCHPHISVIGELGSLRKRLRASNGKSLCSFHREKCEFWSNERINILKRLLGLKLSSSLSSRFLLAFGYLRLMIQINKWFPATDTLVDSSKAAVWAMNSRHLFRMFFDTKYIFLTRNPKALVASHMRKGRCFDDALAIVVGELKNIWKLMPLVDNRDRLQLSYEDFVSKPEASLSRVCDFLGFEFDESMLNYSQYRHHIVGGNAGPRKKAQENEGHDSSITKSGIEFYSKQEAMFFVDRRWENELSSVRQKYIDRVLSDVRACRPIGGHFIPNQGDCNGA